MIAEMESAVAHPVLQPSISLIARLDNRKFRCRLYLLIAVCFLGLGWCVAAGKSAKKHEPIDFIFSDAQGYYVYLPTLLLDHNLDFQKRQAMHATMHPADDDTSASEDLKRNRWPTGVAITLAPAFLVAHALAMALSHITSSDLVSPSGYSLPYQVLCSASAMATGCWGLYLADGMIARELRLRGQFIAAGVITYWVGTNYAYYFFREPLMAHLISSTWVIAVASICQQLIEAARQDEPVIWHWPALAGAMSMAIVCRLTNASLLPLLLLTGIRCARREHLVYLLKCLPIMLAATLPVWLQFFIWHHSVATSTGGALQQIGYHSQERFYWTDPCLLKTLISSRHGLLFWSPAILLSLVGLLAYIARGGWRDAWLMGLCASGLLLWYLNSAWYAWGFGFSFGARAFVELAGLFIAGFALAFDRLSNKSPRLRWSVFAALLLTIVYSYCMMALYIFKVLPRDDYLLPHTGIKPPHGLDSYYRPYIKPALHGMGGK